MSVPGRGTLSMRPTQSAPETQLDVPYTLLVTDEGRIVVYVKGGSVLPATFELSTMFRPGS